MTMVIHSFTLNPSQAQCHQLLECANCSGVGEGQSGVSYWVYRPTCRCEPVAGPDHARHASPKSALIMGACVSHRGH